MGIRESINRHPGIALASLASVLAALSVIIFLNFRGGDDVVVAKDGGPKSFYTVDDGKSWFADRAKRVTPFEHEGKTAYRCYVWTCVDGKTTFVSHLERLKASVRAGLKGKDQVEPFELIPGSVEVKAPLTGDAGWVDSMSPDAITLQTPRCPGGKPGIPQPARVP